jgi:3-hydroxybutyryl-CoA dehydrogenase
VSVPAPLSRCRLPAGTEHGQNLLVVELDESNVHGHLACDLGGVRRDAMRMVEEGVATAADVDKAMRLGYRHPMGPLELADLVGLDARLNNVRSMYAQAPLEQYRPPAILERLVAAGRLGRKTRSGFYDYDEGGAMLGPAADLP